MILKSVAPSNGNRILLADSVNIVANNSAFLHNAIEVLLPGKRKLYKLVISHVEMMLIADKMGFDVIEREV